MGLILHEYHFKMIDMCLLFPTLDRINNKSIMNMIFSLSPERMSHVPHEEPHPVFNRFQGANRSHRRNHPCYNPQIHMFSTVWVSLASSNPSSLPRDANTLLRYPSTWQIRLLAGWLAGWQSSGQSVGVGSAGQIIEYHSL